MLKKKYTALVAALIMALVVTMFVPVQKAEASTSAYKCSQPAIYPNQIVLDINSDAYQSNWTVYNTHLYVRADNGGAWTEINSFPNTIAKKVTVSNLSAAYQYDVKLTCDYKTSYGTTYTDDTICWIYGAVLAPVKVSGLKQDTWYSSGALYTIWNEQASTSGYQFELYNAKNKCIKRGTSQSYSPRTNFSNLSYQTYKMRVRAYTSFNGSNRYGAWSEWTYIVPPPKSLSGKSSKKGKITLKWSKVKGATSYTILVSTKKNKGYKVAKTVSAKKTKATIKKMGKKKLKSNKYYYVYVRPNKKVNGKNVYSTFSNAYITYLYGRVK